MGVHIFQTADDGVQEIEEELYWAVINIENMHVYVLSEAGTVAGV